MRCTLLLWVASLMVAAGLASAVTLAQTRQPPRLLTGADIGFRVEGLNRSGQPTGTLVVRLNGEWVTVGTDTRVHPVK